MHRRLGRAAASRVGGIAIHPVFRDVEIEAAQVDGAELIKRVIDLVKLVSRVSRPTFRDHILEPIQDPAIEDCSGGLWPSIAFCRAGLWPSIVLVAAA